MAIVCNSLETWLRLLCTCQCQYLTISHAHDGKMKHTWSWSMMECVCPSHWSTSQYLLKLWGLLANWWCCEVQDGRARHPLSVLMLTRSIVLLLQLQQGCQASYSLTFCILLLCGIDSQVKPWCRHFNIIRSQSKDQYVSTGFFCTCPHHISAICDDPIFSSPSYMTVLRNGRCSFFIMDIFITAL